MVNKNLSLSVVIPVKDRKESLMRAVRSVIDQSYPVQEIIVVDDGSSERLDEFVQKFSPRVTYLRNEQSMGAPFARNRGWMHAKTDVIAFLDSDDEWTTDCLKNKVEKLIADDLDLVIGSFTIEQSGISKPFRFQVKAQHPLRDHLLMNTPFDARTSTFVVKRTVLEKIGFDEQLKKHQDWDLFINLDYQFKTGFTNLSDAVLHISENDRISVSLKHDSTRHFIKKNKDKVSADALFMFELKMLYKSAIRNDQEGIAYYRDLVINTGKGLRFQYQMIRILISLKILNVSFLHRLKQLFSSRR